MPVPYIIRIGEYYPGPQPWLIPWGNPMELSERGYVIPAGSAFTYAIEVGARYVWNYYASAPPAYADTVGEGGSGVKSGTVYYSASYTFDAVSGVYTLVSPSSAQVRTKPSLSGMYFIFGAATGESVYYDGAITGSLLVYTASWASVRAAVYRGDYSEPVDEPVGTVYDTDHRAYPHHGAHTDGYYYIRDVFVWETHKRDYYISSYNTATSKNINVSVSAGDVLEIADDYAVLGVLPPEGSDSVDVPPNMVLVEPVTTYTVTMVGTSLYTRVDGKYWRKQGDSTDMIYYGASGTVVGSMSYFTGVTQYVQVPVYTENIYSEASGTVYSTDPDAYPEDGVVEGTTTPVYRLVP